MAVCAGITYDSSANKINIEYSSADGQKGSKEYDSPFRYIDIFDTDVANGWGVFFQDSTTTFRTKALIHCLDVNAYFLVEGETLFLDDPLTYSSSVQTIYFINLKFISRRLYVASNSGQPSVFIGMSRGNIYFSGSSIDISNTVISRFVRVNFYNGVVIDRCWFDGNSFPNIGNSGVSVQNTVMSYTSFGLQFNSQLDLFSGNIIRDCTQAIGWYGGDIVLSDLVVKNCTKSWYLVFNNLNRLAKIYNSDVGMKNTDISPYASNSGVLVMQNYSTFKGEVIAGVGGLLKVKDKDGNILFEISLTSDTISGIDVMFEQNSVSRIDGIISYAYLDYQPFSIEISKWGYDTLIIPNIYVTPGQPTVIRGAMVATAPTPPSISSLQITNPGTTNDDGQIAITAENGTQPYTYSINGTDYQESDTFTGLSAGTYSVYVKDANDSVDMITGIELKADPIITPRVVLVSITHPSYYNNDGEIMVTTIDGVAPYEYRLNDGEYQSEYFFTGLSEGEYIIYVRDSLGTIGVLEGIKLQAETIPIPALTILNITQPNSSNNNGVIEVTADNGVEPYEYSINDGEYQSSNIFSELSEGEYKINVRDSLGTIGVLEGINLKSTILYDQSIEVSLSSSNIEVSIVEEVLSVEIVDEILVVE